MKRRDVMTLSLVSFGFAAPLDAAFLLYYNNMKKLIFLLALSQAVALAADQSKLESAAEDRTSQDVALLSELLAIPSVSRDIAQTDRAIAWMKDFLEKRGVWCAVETCPKDGPRPRRDSRIPTSRS